MRFVRSQSHPNNTTMFGFVHLESGMTPARNVQIRASIHGILRLGSENSLNPAACGSRTQNGAHFLKFLRQILAIYGTGIAGTFAWLFFALSGFATCAPGWESCQFVIGRAGQLALIWPAYWGGRFSGNDALTPVVSVEMALVAIPVYFGALLLTLAFTQSARAGSGPARGDPKSRATGPDRRDQSQTSRWVRGAQS